MKILLLPRTNLKIIVTYNRFCETSPPITVTWLHSRSTLARRATQLFRNYYLFSVDAIWCSPIANIRTRASGAEKSSINSSRFSYGRLKPVLRRPRTGNGAVARLSRSTRTQLGGASFHCIASVLRHVRAYELANRLRYRAITWCTESNVRVLSVTDVIVKSDFRFVVTQVRHHFCRQFILHDRVILLSRWYWFMLATSSW